MFVLALFACSNTSPPGFAGGGERHSEGVAASEDVYNPWGIGDDEDTGTTTETTETTDTNGDPDGPVLSAVDYDWTGVTRLALTVAYTDTQDDVEGGYVFWDLTGEDDLSGSYEVNTAGYESGMNAENQGSALFLELTSADSTKAWTFGVTVEDASGNQSNRLVQDIAAES